MASPISGQPQIAEQCDALAREIEYQNVAVDHLLDRLGPVMSLSSPDGTADKKSSEPTCELASRLAGLSCLIRSNSAVLTSILRRLEI